MSPAVALPEPPLPVQVSVKLTVPVVVGDSGCVPLVDCAPLHPSLAVHAVALVELQVTVAVCPTVIVAGATVIVTVGAGVVTLSAAVAWALPLARAHRDAINKSGVYPAMLRCSAPSWIKFSWRPYEGLKRQLCGGVKRQL